ncbi:MAG: helix-turn-helix domain-containing protein, partial [Coprobacillaceae bacterium]
MNQLFFSLIRDNKTKREIELLTILSKNEVITIQELAETIGVSSRSITNDLRFIEQELKDVLHIERFKRGGIKLIWDHSNSIEHTISILAMNTLSFRLIDGLFQGMEMSVEEWAEYLYASKITMYRTIDHVSKIMETYHCSIEKGSIVKFGGEEINIRFFLYVFYSECNTLFNIKRRLENDRCLLLQAEHHLLLDYKSASEWCLIGKQRVKLGYHIQITSALQQDIISKETYQEFKKNV